MTAPALDASSVSLWADVSGPVPADRLRIGLRHTGAAVDLGPAAGAARARLLADQLAAILPAEEAELTSLEWASLAAEPGRPVHLVATVVRCRAERGAGTTVLQDLRVVVDEDPRTVVLRGQAGWHVAGAQPPETDRVRVALEVGSVPWGHRIAERLATNSEFRSTTTPFDGAISFSSGADEVSFRVYRGAVVEVARKAVLGPTFTIRAPELTWLELLASPTNDYVRRTMTKAFTVRGDGFQYVRMIKAIMVILDEARAEATEALHA